MSYLIASGGSPLSGTIQRGSITQGSNTSTTATITSVDVNNSRLRLVGFSVSGQNTNNTMMPVLALTNATTLTQTTNSATNVPTSSYEVSPLRVGVLKSIQRGTMGANTTATITAVGVNNTEVDNLGSLGSNGDTNIMSVTRVTLTNATTLTSVGFTDGGSNTVGYQAAEFNL